MNYSVAIVSEDEYGRHNLSHGHFHADSPEEAYEKAMGELKKQYPEFTIQRSKSVLEIKMKCL